MNLFSKVTPSIYGTNTLVVLGGEIDICVLAAILGAVDFGCRVIIASNALCSSDNKS
jgi:nicotinamidase-related amidase